jgi:hypothetical protein
MLFRERHTAFFQRKNSATSGTTKRMPSTTTYSHLRQFDVHAGTCFDRGDIVLVSFPLAIFINTVMRTISNLPVFDKEVTRIRFAFVRSRRLSNVNSATICSTVARFIHTKNRGSWVSSGFRDKDRSAGALRLWAFHCSLIER